MDLQPDSLSSLMVASRVPPVASMGIKDERDAFVHVACEFDVVLDRLKGFLVAVETDDRCLGTGDHVVDAVEHAETGAQDGHHGDLLAFDGIDFDFACPTVNGGFLGLKILGCFVSQQPGDFVCELAKRLVEISCLRKIPTLCRISGWSTTCKATGLPLLDF